MTGFDPVGHRPDDIGNDPVLGIVSAADHVAAARCGQADALLAEISLAIGPHDHLGRRLGRGIRVLAAERRALVESRAALVIGVDLVRGDDENCRDLGALPQRLENMGRAHHVGRESVAGIGDRGAHQRPRRQMQDDFGSGGAHSSAHGSLIPEVAEGTRAVFADMRQFEQCGAGGGRKGEAIDLRAHRAQPKRQPAALEPRVTGQEHAPAGPERWIDHRAPCPDAARWETDRPIAGTECAARTKDFMACEPFTASLARTKPGPPNAGTA